MTKTQPLSIDDPAADCPIPPETVGQLIKADADTATYILDGIPEATRARLAVWLYGRSHTHEIGVRVAATCDGATLRRAAGVVGTALYDASRRPYKAPSHGARPAGSRISLGGSSRRA
ncbi:MULTISPECIES: hypothetical protein [Methylobacterium]|jgi:hypothetical protein|uniref:hypothetical protein n=1 Tax=Methylobacterium TaxID=407 RepID=UPI0011C1DE18|nr:MULTISPECIES: hypothetical protein [Methylobacterium]QEE37661.1 hypothetical protein FVA80_00520 [Methylobacterium sp. WL1]TXN00936.1 hypothetical protein FV242_20395 [Methylobacterium sp. WL64]TXN48371.1 hypothetical protein FV233_01380 [Methylobacterium sp. WL7]TXN56289.1 hypothetical protein FV241_16085 [Methylobacterium sp. WL2]TXN67733.1 hypothetical protein FV228_13930 [Methylobacterium sp. WL18]